MLNTDRELHLKYMEETTSLNACRFAHPALEVDRHQEALRAGWGPI